MHESVIDFLGQHLTFGYSIEELRLLSKSPSLMTLRQAKESLKSAQHFFELNPSQRKNYFHALMRVIDHQMIKKQDFLH